MKAVDYTSSSADAPGVFIPPPFRAFIVTTHDDVQHSVFAHSYSLAAGHLVFIDVVSEDEVRYRRAFANGVWSMVDEIDNPTSAMVN